LIVAYLLFSQNGLKKFSNPIYFERKKPFVDVQKPGKMLCKRREG
jgi:hypothetical protein